MKSYTCPQKSTILPFMRKSTQFSFISFLLPNTVSFISENLVGDVHGAERELFFRFTL